MPGIHSRNCHKALASGLFSALNVFKLLLKQRSLHHACMYSMQSGQGKQNTHNLIPITGSIHNYPHNAVRTTHNCCTLPP